MKVLGFETIINGQVQGFSMTNGEPPYGRTEIIDIEYHEPREGDNAHYCDVITADGNQLRMFNLQSVTFLPLEMSPDVQFLEDEGSITFQEEPEVI